MHSSAEFETFLGSGELLPQRQLGPTFRQAPACFLVQFTLSKLAILKLTLFIDSMLVKKITIEYLWKNIVHRQNIEGESKNSYKEWA